MHSSVGDSMLSFSSFIAWCLWCSVDSHTKAFSINRKLMLRQKITNFFSIKTASIKWWRKKMFRLVCSMLRPSEKKKFLEMNWKDNKKYCSSLLFWFRLMTLMSKSKFRRAIFCFGVRRNKHMLCIIPLKWFLLFSLFTNGQRNHLNKPKLIFIFRSQQPILNGKIALKSHMNRISFDRNNSVQ